jgi:hypothetical protein
MPQPRSWRGFRDQYIARLKQQTGEDLDTWNCRIQSDGPDDEQGLRDWLDERGIHGYLQMLLVMERFGYPDFLETEDDELIDNQYTDREHLRPILDKILALVRTRHSEVEVVGRKTYVPLYTPKRQFAVVKATTKSRVDLGFRLDGEAPNGRLKQAKNLGNETINLCVPLTSFDEVDDEVAEIIDRAWQANS